jgi:hypothetical protein
VAHLSNRHQRLDFVYGSDRHKQSTLKIIFTIGPLKQPTLIIGFIYSVGWLWYSVPHRFFSIDYSYHRTPFKIKSYYHKSFFNSPRKTIEGKTPTLPIDRAVLRQSANGTIFPSMLMAVAGTGSTSCVLGAVHTYSSITYQNLQPQTLVSAVPYQLLERFSPLINLSDPLLIRATCSFVHRWNQSASTTFCAPSVLSIGCACEESSYCFVFGLSNRAGRAGRVDFTWHSAICAARRLWRRIFP